MANELSGNFAKVGAPQADNDSSNSPEIFHTNIFLAKHFDRNTLFNYSKLYFQPSSVLSLHTRRQNI